jgi:2-methylcitrate dehydratase
LRKAFEDPSFSEKVKSAKNLDDIWKLLMLSPYDYGYSALYNQSTRTLMEKCTFTHGGKEYDEKYPEGIPTSV